MADNRRILTFEEVHALLLERCIPEPNSGCLLWTGATPAPKGRRRQLYGSIRLNGRMEAVHRVAYQAAHGAIPTGAQILHRCDVGLCCNPNHLFVGDYKANIADKVAKDRARKRLTIDKARRIHEMATSGVSHTKLAQLFGVRQSTISRICAGERRPAALPANL